MPRRHYAIGIDISERKRAEQAQAQAVAAAERANRAKSEFLSHMSHELRTPLNGVLGFAQLLRASVTGLGPRERDWLRTIEHSSRHLAALVDDVLDHSRIEAGEMRVQRDVIDLAALAGEVRKTVQASARDRGITLRLAGGPGPLHAWGDSLRARQVLLNLAGNAVKYNRRGGQVEIGLQAGDGCVRVSVTDDGPGLSADQLAQLFKPYERLGAERGHVQGTGIGLSIARRLAQLMDGDIVVQSEPGRGSRFTLWLPAAAAQGGDADPATTDFGALAASDRAAGYRVLYAEDNEVNRLVFEACLARRPGIELHLAHDGREALALAGSLGFDLVVLDLNLPDVDGLSLARALQAQPAQRDARLALLTADAAPETVKAARACGISRVWRKPFDAADLLAQIDDALEPA
jgi:CheY-like chemotaxis protein